MAARNPILDRFFNVEFREYRYRPVEFARRVLEIEPHDDQQKWLLSSIAPENAVTTGNQWGKTFSGAIKHIWRGSYRKGWNAEIVARAAKGGQDWESMNVGPTADQAQLAWRKAEAFLHARRAQWLVKDVKYSPFPCITLFNGAKIQARTTGNDGNRLLGYTLDFINWDEAARERNFEKIRDDVLRMRLVARRGMLDYTTTGNGRNAYGVYFLTGLPGDKKDPNLYSQTGSSLANPYVDKERLLMNAARLPERMRRQNIGGEIVDAGGGYFSIEDIEACINRDLTEAMVVEREGDYDDIRRAEVYCDRDVEAGKLGVPWHNKYPHHRYVHFWDVADKQDWCVGRTLDTSTDRMVAVEFERFNAKGWAYNIERIRERHHRYSIGHIDSEGHGSSKTIIDSTGVGDVVVDALSDINAEAFFFTKQTKDEVLTGLQEAMSLRRFEMPMIAVEYDELKFYEREDKDLVQDCVMSLAGAVHFGRRQPYEYAGWV